jgi:hypothetical protein
LGVNLQSARLIWESSRDVTHEELEPRESWLVMTPGIGFLGQLAVSSSKSRTISSGLLGDWTFETDSGVSKSAP